MEAISILGSLAALAVSVASLLVSIWALRGLAERDRREDETYAEIARRLCGRGE